MSNNLPALSAQERAVWQSAHATLELTQEQVDAGQRRMMTSFMEVAMRPYTPREGGDGEDERFRGKPMHEVMYTRVMEAATQSKPDLRAAEFIQEHLLGKAVQRIESQNVTVTYQDLLAQTAEREKRFREKQKELNIDDVTDVEPIAEAPPVENDIWSQFL